MAFNVAVILPSAVYSTFHYTLCGASNKNIDELGSGAIGRSRRLGFHSRWLVTVVD